MSSARPPNQLQVVTLDAPPPEDRFVLVVPGQQAPLYSFDLPNGVTGPARVRIATQQLADRIGSGPDAIDLVPFGRDELWTRAIVFDGASRGEWAAQAAARSGRCRAILPDYLALPAADGHVSLRRSGDAVLARIGLLDGFSAPVALAAPLLDRALRTAQANTVSLDGDLPTDVAAVVARAGLVTGPAPDAAFSNGEVSSDLRQGGGSTEGARTTLKLWLIGVALALLSFGLWAGSVAIETGVIRADTAALRDETTRILRGGLVPAGPILDIRQQVTRALEDAGAAGAEPRPTTPMALLSDATVALFGKAITVETVAFSAEDGLNIRIVASSFAEIDALVAEMRESGLGATAQNLRALDSGGVTARIDVASSQGEQP